MKKLKFSWMLLALSLSVVSCSSDDNNDGGGTASVVKLPIKILSYERNTGVLMETMQYTYNADNSIAEMNEGGGIMKCVYNSSGQLVEINHYGNPTSPTLITDKETFTYDSDKVVYSHSLYSATPIPYNYVYTNTAARTVKKTDIHPDASYYGESLYTYDSKGNMTKDEYSKKSNGVVQPAQVSTFTYDNKSGVFSNVKLSIPWTVCSEWADDWMVEYFMANNVASYKSSGMNAAVTYEYDADGYPVEMKIDGKLASKFEYKTVSK